MAVKVPSRRVEFITEKFSKAVYSKAQNVLKSLSGEIHRIQPDLEGQNLELKIFSENLDSIDESNQPPPALSLYLVDKTKEEPFFAALSPSMQFSLNSSDNIAVTAKTKQNITTGFTESTVSLDQPIEIVLNKLEESITEFLEKSIPNLGHGAG